MDGLANLRIDQGSTWTQFVRYEEQNGSDIDLTGCQLRMQARLSYECERVIIDLSTYQGGIVFTEQTKGEFTLNLSDVDTSALDPGSYVYDIELIHPDLSVERLVAGSIIVTPEVTR